MVAQSGEALLDVARACLDAARTSRAFGAPPSPCGRLVAPLWGPPRGELNRACWTRSSITASRVPPISDPGYYGSLSAALRLLREARTMGLRYLTMGAISAVLLSITQGACTGLWAEERLPAHPVHLIVPAPAGGSLDIGIRIIEPRLSVHLRDGAGRGLQASQRLFRNRAGPARAH